MKVLSADPLVVEVSEWETAELPDTALSTDDERAIARFSDDGRKLRIDWLRGDRLRIAASSWIGVVRLDAVEIRIVPKLVGGDAGVLRMLSYAAGLRSLRNFPSSSALGVEGRHLLDLIGQLLIIETRRLVDAGLLHDYVTREETLPGLRGRLRQLDQLCREFGRVDRLACRYDEYETDVVENRLVAAGLEAGRRLCDDGDIRRRLASLGSLFQEVCEIDGHDVIDEASDIHYHRRNENYRAAHAWSLLLLRQLAVRDLFETTQATRLAFLLDMNLLFEQFVSQILEDGFSGSGVRVYRQRRDLSILFDEVATRPYGAVIPDVVLERKPLRGGADVLPLDVKYKMYDARRVDSSDIYQTFLYAFAYRGDTPPHPVVIVYPRESTGEGFRLVVRDATQAAGARLHGIALDVPAALNAIANGLPNTELVSAIAALMPTPS